MSKIWAIGDLHLDHTKDKSMDIFGEDWRDHDEKIFNFWIENVGEEDWVLVPGDISWALKWEEAYQDLKAIHDLPGQKILSKGNHDYWWTSLKKMEGIGLDSLHFIHNTSVQISEDTYVVGSRGWISRDASEFTDQDEKITLRELHRLNLAIDQVPQGKRMIAMIHYPPFLQSFEASDFTRILSERGVDLCLYGHLHGNGHKYIFEGDLDGVDYQCVAADYLDFKCKELSWKEKLK